MKLFDSNDRRAVRGYIILDEDLEETEFLLSTKYVYLPDSKSVDEFYEDSEMLDLTTKGINGRGLYVFDDTYGKFVDLGEKISLVAELLKSMCTARINMYEIYAEYMRKD